MKNIVVYGAGVYGKSVINILQKTNSINIIMVCDSNKEKWGINFNGYTICSPDNIFKIEKLDGIFIAILSDNDVEEYILNKRKIRIYKSTHELVAETIYWDISGSCNAKCKYCVTGRKNRNSSFIHKKDSYMTLETFKKSYEHLYIKGIISKESHLGLYNWKEPFLNPEVMDILSYCSDVEQNYNISTNASIVKLAENKNTYTKCEAIYFSMPGFSQESYDRIHGFSFENIKNNIIKIKNDMLEHGFTGRYVINAHIYKFSEKELEDLKSWAEKEDILVNAYYPYLAGNSLINDYFEGRLDLRTQKDISSDLFLQWDKKINENDLRKFINPLCNQLTIDENGNFTICCAADEFCDDYDIWGKIESVKTYEDYKLLKEKMLKSKSCVQCRKYAMAYRMITLNQW